MSSIWPGASQWRIYYHRMRGQLSTTCSNILKYPNEELLVAVDHNQQQTLASETVDPIDWSYQRKMVALLPSWAVSPKRLVHSINRCRFKWESTSQPSACEATTLPMRTPKRAKIFALIIKSSLLEGIFVDNIGVNCTSLEIVRAKKYYTHKYILKSFDTSLT